MAVGANRRAVLDSLDPQNTGINPAGAVAASRGLPPPALTPAAAPGLQLPNEQAAPLVPPPAAAAPAPPPADFSGQLEGFNADKLAANKNDPKYRFASIAKGFDVRDPGQRQALSDALAADTSGFFKGGLQGDMIQALDPATGQFGGVDVIRGLDAGGQGWQWGAGAGSAGTPPPSPQIPQQGGNAGLQMAQSNLSGLLSGDPYGPLQQALGKVPQPNLQALIAQLGGQ